MEGLGLPIILLLTVAIVTGLRNVVQYEMQEVYGIEHEAVGSWWRQRVNSCYIYMFLLDHDFCYTTMHLLLKRIEKSKCQT